MVQRVWSAEDSEFGLGRGIIDPVARQNRTLTPDQHLIEIYATNPSLPNVGNGELAPGEVLLTDENRPETCTVDRP